MSKGLEALEHIRKVNYYEDEEEIVEDCYGIEKDLSIIEKELKELEETKVLCESFKNDINRLNEQGINLYLKRKKQTQILKILKEKKVDLLIMSVCKTYEEYNHHLVREQFMLTKEEFDLLKEWLHEN